MFRRILLWFAGMLVFTSAAFWFTNKLLEQSRPSKGGFLDQVMSMEFDEAIRHYENGGAKAAGSYLERVDKRFNARHLLLDRNDRDVVTGEDRSKLAAQAATGPRFPPPKDFVARKVSADGRYQFLIHAPAPINPARNLPVYLWIVAAVAGLCYILAWTLAKPVRTLHDAVVRFGKGDLTSRAGLRRRDEIGELSTAFDQMADRIQMLMTAERRLLQDVSHELRSPLARLKFALELARSSPDPKAGLERVGKEVSRLSTLIGELLHITRTEGDPDSRNLSSIDLRAFLQEIVDESRIEADARGVRLAFKADDKTLWTGDKELLHRAFENVVRNAIHHAPKDTDVGVGLESGNGQIVVSVRDRGEGVPEDQLQNIFRPFYRVEEDRNRASGGVGLGLAIAERAIRAHHGDIRAENARPGLLVEMRLPK
jgi:signal transduction histidine kinase